MPAFTSKLAIASAALALLSASIVGAMAQKKYDTGTSDTEIKMAVVFELVRRSPRSKLHHRESSPVSCEAQWGQTAY
jgi:hypothetical protein